VSSEEWALSSLLADAIVVSVGVCGRPTWWAQRSAWPRRGRRGSCRSSRRAGSASSAPSCAPRSPACLGAKSRW